MAYFGDMTVLGREEERMLVVQIKDFVHHNDEDVTNGDADYVVEVDNGRLITRAMVRIHINEANQPPEATTVSGQAMFQSTRYWTSEIEVGFIVTDHESNPADLEVTVSTGAIPLAREPFHSLIVRRIVWRAV